MIEFENISHRYGPVTALDSVSHTFETGTTTVLIGPSGCGKSTLLRAIVGLVNPADGLIRIYGDDVTADSIERVRKKVGYVIQDGGLFPHMTALENVTLLARQERWGNTSIEHRIDELLDFVQLSRSHLRKYPSQLSGGQLQRVSIMRSLMMDPEILLMDEPLGALDSIVRADLQRDLLELFERLKKTVVMITHDLAEAAYFSDNLLLMRDGSIIIHGNLGQLYSSLEPFVSEFINAQKQAAEAFIKKL